MANKIKLKIISVIKSYKLKFSDFRNNAIT